MRNCLTGMLWPVYKIFYIPYYALLNTHGTAARGSFFKNAGAFFLYLALSATIPSVYAQEKSPPGTVRGIVTDEKNEPLAGATLQLENNTIRTRSNGKGEFSLQGVSDGAVLDISFIGYKTQQTVLNVGADLRITLQPDVAQLREVTVNTGYQELPKERATGSFSKVDNELFNRRVSTDVISRLQDNVPGLIVNTGKGAAAGLVIRGQSTIFSNASPLIVVDNFPYEGDVNNINPNDVESVTVLKDAAAASIWGARAGNGVIVITTKRGRYDKPVQLSFNTNFTLGAKPDIYYQPKISSADFIGKEQDLFNQGYYTGFEEAYNHPPFTPAVELMIDARDGKISESQLEEQLGILKQQDVRKDYDRYLYRNSFNQQYAFNLQGGGTKQSYFLSAGYDHNKDNAVGNAFGRMSFTAGNRYKFLGEKLELSAAVYYTHQKSQLNSLGIPTYSSPDGYNPSVELYPYAQLADWRGNYLDVIKNYRLSFTQAAAQQGLLNWNYNPLAELQMADNTGTGDDYRINTGLSYKIIQGLQAQILYQYGKSTQNNGNLYHENSYYARDLVNQYTQVDAVSGLLTRPVPTGGIRDEALMATSYYNVRGQLNYVRNWQDKHDVSVLGGMEVRNLNTLGSYSRLYGYDAVHASAKAVDYVNPYPLYLYGYGSNIPYADRTTELSDRYLSYFTNGAYTYDRRYTLSASLRFDQSNLFGVKTNQKGVPLYSIGAAWAVSNESFYNAEWLPYLRLRATYGYSGNVNKSLSAYTTAYYNPNDDITRLPYANIVNPPNPDLRWEKYKISNAGLDFASHNNRISGTLEFYLKKGYDIIGNTAYPGSSGVRTFTGNYANTSGNGYDISLNSLNLTGAFGWTSNLILSHAVDKVTHYTVTDYVTSYLNSADGTMTVPLEGKPLYSVYSLPWAGLDPQTGDPQGYFNGELSKDYSAIIGAATPVNIVYNGPARPTYFGSFRNSFSYKSFSLSATINYRFGYYFRNNSISYVSLLQGTGGHGDYSFRWRQPGDEKVTNVPSTPAFVDYDRDFFYASSSVLVEKGDHIRLQDITFSYDLLKAKMPGLPFNSAQVYLYANNLGIIWKSAGGGIDPDYAVSNFPPVRTIAAGVRINFN
ncbi:SusC/RagA family TonB-linked outer membrane protein [Pedobacter sp. HMF7647]|uniref:SusC/RagA family TonB-linked outer membrane protein n=1 Tax=Hufsiella arboris TaxID=2695275 RepID=A0A7K1Y5T9_9SPHI|nr:SusC/RagA family TonB-linked outer membrane protein [Hufsiella arboris]MXV49942.1 SusC/RagA family TonB-linked outer membrane protein [Hufsiella arboris]